MKVSLAVSFFGLLSLTLFAQSPTTSKAPPSASPAPLPDASPSNESVEPPSLIPPNILPAPNALPKLPNSPALEQLDTFFKQSSLGKKADDFRLHLQLTSLEVRVRNDPELHALQADAEAARTDLEKRHRLKTYYDAYYRKVTALASNKETQDYIVSERAAHELRLLQPRTRHETDEAAAAALVGKTRPGSTPSAKALPTPVQARAGVGHKP